MSRLTFARSAGAAGPKMTDVGIDRQTDRQTDRGRVELPRWDSLTLAPINFWAFVIAKEASFSSVYCYCNAMPAAAL